LNEDARIYLPDSLLEGERQRPRTERGFSGAGEVLGVPGRALQVIYDYLSSPRYGRGGPLREVYVVTAGIVHGHQLVGPALGRHLSLRRQDKSEGTNLTVALEGTIVPQRQTLIVLFGRSVPQGQSARHVGNFGADVVLQEPVNLFLKGT